MCSFQYYLCMYIFLRLHIGPGRAEDEVQRNGYQEQRDTLHGSEGHVADVPAAQIIEYESQGVP